MLIQVLTRAVPQLRRGSSSASSHPPFSLQASAQSPSLWQKPGAPALSAQRMRTLPRVTLRSATTRLVVRSHWPGPPPLVKMPAPPLSLHRSEEHTSELQSHVNLVCRLLLEKKKKILIHY